MNLVRKDFIFDKDGNALKTPNCGLLINNEGNRPIASLRTALKYAIYDSSRLNIPVDFEFTTYRVRINPYDSIIQHFAGWRFHVRRNRRIFDRKYAPSRRKGRRRTRRSRKHRLKFYELYKDHVWGRDSVRDSIILLQNRNWLRERDDKIPGYNDLMNRLMLAYPVQMGNRLPALISKERMGYKRDSIKNTGLALVEGLRFERLLIEGMTESRSIEAWMAGKNLV